MLKEKAEARPGNNARGFLADAEEQEGRRGGAYEGRGTGSRHSLRVRGREVARRKEKYYPGRTKGAWAKALGRGEK